MDLLHQRLSSTDNAKYNLQQILLSLVEYQQKAPAEYGGCKVEGRSLYRTSNESRGARQPNKLTAKTSMEPGWEGGVIRSSRPRGIIRRLGSPNLYYLWSKLERGN